MRGSLGRAKLALVAAFSLIATGCLTIHAYDPGPGKRVAAFFAQDTYLSGGAVNVTIANLSEVTLFYPDGFCKTELQRKDPAGWMTVSKLSTSCPDGHNFLDPGQSLVHQYQLPQGISMGTYRLAIPMPVPDEATKPEPELLTPVFTVARSSLPQN